MTDFYETNVDKFTFRVAKDRFYTREGVWAQPEGLHIRIGLSDFMQQRSGDIAFAEVKPTGSAITFSDEIAVIETIKVNLSLDSPVSGKIVEINPALETAPEVINQDPYGTGWLAIIEAADWATDQERLMDPQSYFAQMKAEAENETKR